MLRCIAKGYTSTTVGTHEGKTLGVSLGDRAVASVT